MHEYVRHECGLLAYTEHPTPTAQCGHHCPAGESISCTPSTLQHIVHVPQWFSPMSLDSTASLAISGFRPGLTRRPVAKAVTLSC
jgi:hypothetical protein